MAGTLWDEIMQGTGGPTVNDGLLAYYRANGATGTTLMDAEKQWLAIQGGVLFEDASWRDVPGLTGTINDRMYQYWAAVNAPVPPTSTLVNDLLFALGEKGTWLLPDDPTTVFQDAAGTIPAAVGQPVGLIRDKSPNGWHFSQPTNALRPMLIQNPSGHRVLDFNGVDQWMVSNVVDLASNQVTVFSGVRKQADAVAGTIIELSVSSVANNGTFALFGPSGAGQNNFQWRSRGTISVARLRTPFVAPVSAVLTGIGDITGDISDLRVDGVGAPGPGDQGVGPYLPYQIYMGRRAGTGTAFQGQINEMIIRGAATPTPTVQQIEAYLAAQL